MPLNQGMDKMYYFYITEYLVFPNITRLLKNNVMKFAGQWGELEEIILSEVTQTQKDKHGVYSLRNRH